MKLVGTNLHVEVKNISDGIISRGRFSLQHKESAIIHTVRYPEDILKSLENFYAIKYVDLKLVDVDGVEKPEKSKNIISKTTVKNKDGDTNEHVVYDPDTASKNRVINVESNIEQSKSVEVSFSKVDAIEFLEKHWKTVEKEIEKVDSLERLGFLLSVAKELGFEGNKKYELIEDRIEAVS